MAWGVFLVLRFVYLGHISDTLQEGRKWAWYFLLVVGGITNFGVLALTYTGTPSLLPLIILLFILWIAALALPAKEILGKPSQKVH